MKKFAIIGAAGYIAPKHVEAIYNNGGKIVATIDKSDSVGYLDKFDMDIEHFTDIHKFFSFIKTKNVDFVTICSPNFIHCDHTIDCLLQGFNVICEKPLLINDFDIKQLKYAVQSTKKKVFPILQLRNHREFLKLKKLVQNGSRNFAEVHYVTPRGKWYNSSWKSKSDKSGGLAMNIGIHLFDLLFELFGLPEFCTVSKNTGKIIIGTITFHNATANFNLSIDPDLRPSNDKKPVRIFKVNGKSVDLSENSSMLHSVNYERIITGQSPNFNESFPVIKFINKYFRK